VAAAPLEVAVVDYGSGNLRSVARALERSGFAPRVTGDPDAVRRCRGVVLPGVGAFADAVASLRVTGLDEAVRERVAAGAPYLGLCLGLQLLYEESDEHGVTPGLGLLRGRVERFPKHDADGAPLRVPHIGWNSVRFTGDHPLTRRLREEDCFYFVHGYRAIPSDSGATAGWTDYGGPFAAAAARDNLFAVQFHPEKSQNAGRRLLDAARTWFDEVLA